MQCCPGERRHTLEVALRSFKQPFAFFLSAYTAFCFPRLWYLAAMSFLALSLLDLVHHESLVTTVVAVRNKFSKTRQAIFPKPAII